MTARKSILGLFLLSLAVTAPIFFFGVPQGNDLPQHYQFASTYFESLRRGDLLPSWPANANRGLGDLGVRVYPPAGYYYLAASRLVTGNWHIASSVTFLLLFFAGGVGTYLWAREWLSEGAALLSGAIYVIAPYHVNELFNAFTYAEFAAAAVLPFCFLFATRVVDRRSSASVIGLAASFSFLILSHLPTFVLASVALLIYSLIYIKRGERSRSVRALGLGVLLALAASSFYWVRMLGEIRNVAHTAEGYTSGAFDFRANFLGSLLFSLGSDAEARGVGFVDVMFAATLLFFVPGLLLALKTRTAGLGRRIIAIGSIFLLGFFLATPLSLPVWENVRTLQLIQFPWRAMILISLGAAILAGLSFDAVRSALKTPLRPVAIAVAGLMLAGATFTIAQVIRPANYGSTGRFDDAVIQFATAKSCECWWPVWGKQSALDRAGRITAPDRLIMSSTTATDRLSIHLSDGPATAINVGVFYHPNWNATADGRLTTTVPDDDGTMLVQIPEGASTVELSFRESYYVNAAIVVSALAWLSMAVMIALVAIRKRGRTEHL